MLVRLPSVPALSPLSLFGPLPFLSLFTVLLPAPQSSGARGKGRPMTSSWPRVNPAAIWRTRRHQNRPVQNHHEDNIAVPNQGK
ncbi:hypothetical protein VTN00DRAFT_456 [Thermoascus crustaceus]|uniref:uncharacterized protein n=1 Tax=Thermoascus crustaceus TaxID=5088 RepID=UPI0037436FA2